MSFMKSTMMVRTGIIKDNKQPIITKGRAPNFQTPKYMRNLPDHHYKLENVLFLPHVSV